MVHKIRSLRESFLPLLSVLIALLATALIMDMRAAKIIEDYTVLPVSASSETWQSNSLDDDGMDGNDTTFSPDLDEASAETAASRALVDAGRPDKALDLLKDALARDPDNSALLNEMGAVEMRLDRYADAISSLSRAVEKAPGCYRCYFNRGIAHFHINDLNAAAADYEAVIALHPNHYESNYNLGLLKFRTGRYKEAATLLHQSVSLSSGSYRAQALFAEARAQTKLGNKSDAVRLYKKAIEYQPDYILPRFNLAVLLAADKAVSHVETAARYLDEIIALRPDFAPAYFMKGRMASKAGDIGSAIRYYETAVKKDPTFYNARYNLGLAALQQKETARAKSVFTALHREFPNRPEILFNLGKVAYAEADLERAEQYYTEAISSDKNGYLEAAVNLAVVFKASKKYEEALDVLDKLLEKNPRLGSALLNKALVLLSMRRYEDAEKTVLMAKSAGIDTVKVYFNLGIIYADQKRYEEAVRAYEQVLSVAPKHLKSNINMGYSLSKLGRYAEAEAAYRAAIAVSPTYSSARLNLAAVLRKQAKWEASAAQCRAVIARDESDGAAWNNLGVSLAKMGETEQAAEAFSQVLELDPANVKARYNLALQLKKQNETEQAEAELRRVLKLDPEHFQSHLSLADILDEKGMRKDALALLDKALMLRPGDKEAESLKQKISTNQ